MIPRPHRWPAALRGSAYALAVAVLGWLCLAPSPATPGPQLWDKGEHAISWFVLAGLGLLFWPARPGWACGFALAFGALIEVLQWATPFGRDGDWRDWAADGVGVAAALAVRAAARATARRRAPAVS
jgi:VanZ family protein